MTALIDIFKKPHQTRQKEKKAADLKLKGAEKKEKISSQIQTTATKKNLSEVSKILKEPHISEKATYLSDRNKYIFKVYPYANKIRIKKAIRDLYGVQVEDVKIINIKRKKRVLRGIKGSKTGYKKAIIALKKGEKIEIMPH